MIAVGLSLQYGVARVLNVSHGEFIMLGAFLTWTMFTLVGINPLVSLVVCGPVTFALGFVLYRTVYRRIRSASESPEIFEGNSMLASFGFIFIMQNLAILIWGASSRGYSYLAVPVKLAGAEFAANRLVMLFFAVMICLVFYLFLTRTRTGKAIRAAALDPAAAGIMGIEVNRVLALCFGLGALMAGLAGSLLSMSYMIQPTMGFEYTIIAIIVVVIGGLGSIQGSFIGGFILGIIGTIVTYIEPGLSLVAYYLIFMLLLLVKPSGILGR